MATTFDTDRVPAHLDQDYRDLLATLSEGSVHRNFDPYLDIDWDSPEFEIDPKDPRWVLSPVLDPLGATAWYQAQPLEKQIEIGRWRMINAVKVGGAFESILIRGLMHYAMTLPNGSPEFRYCMHEMTEECNHIQMFQELVNRSGVDVPGMRTPFRLLSPLIGLAGGYLPLVLFIGILGGEEPIDHYQKALIRDRVPMPDAVQRTMEIHIAEEARHISFAGEFLKVHMKRQGRVTKAICSVAFPVVMRWLGGEIMTPPKAFERKFRIPKDVMREAFWQSPQSRKIMADYFDDMRALVEQTGLSNRASRALWKRMHIDGEASRYRSEPKRAALTAD